MRYLLILLCICGFGALFWHGAMVGTGQSAMLGAPQIARMVDEGTRTAISGVSDREIKVVTDGRNVRLEGQVGSEDERARIVEAVGDVYLLGRLNDQLQIGEGVSPYTLTATKGADGMLTLNGYVPDRATEDRLVSQAQAVAAGAAVDARLELADGAPDGDWIGMVETGLAALGTLSSGSAAFSDGTVTLTGEAIDNGALGALDSIVAAAPMGSWTNDVTVPASLGGPAVTAMKTADGSIVIDGTAPDAETREALVAHAQGLGGDLVTTNIEVIEAAAPDDWSGSIKQGLSALAVTETGLLSVQGAEGSLDGSVQTDADAARLAALLPEDWTTKIEVLNPLPPGEVTITLAADGSARAVGVLPEGMTTEPFFSALPGVDLSGIDNAATGRPDDWNAPLEGLGIVMSRFDEATAVLRGKTLTVTGALKRGYSAAGSEASLKTVLDEDWTLDMNVSESAPLAEVILTKRGDEISMSGVLPGGLEASEALDLLGETAGGDGLSTGGNGDADAWRQGLAALGDGLGLFDDATARLTAGKADLNGTLRSGYPAGEAEAWLRERMGASWTAGVAATETPAEDGDARVSLSSGEAETYRNGYWLPEVSFDVSTETCAEQVETALQDGKITFVTGSAEIDESGRALLDRIAAVSLRCLNEGATRLEIGGHTDSVGNDANNQRLSEARAGAVLDAMVARGVNPETITATGYGETTPVASNDTPEGRAENRRITFEWSDSDG